MAASGITEIVAISMSDWIELLETPSNTWHPNAPVTPQEIAALVRVSGPLPQDYLSFLLQCGGGEGMLGPNYLVLWNHNDLVEYNRVYEVQKYASGLFLIGSNGGAEAFGFDLRQEPPLIVMTPFVGMGWADSVVIAESFSDFLVVLMQAPL